MGEPTVNIYFSSYGRTPVCNDEVLYTAYIMNTLEVLPPFIVFNGLIRTFTIYSTDNGIAGDYSIEVTAYFTDSAQMIDSTLHFTLSVSASPEPLIVNTAPTF